jgi:hypothetical protein
MPYCREKKGRRASRPSKQRAYKVLSAAETVRELFVGLGRPWQGRIKELWRHWDLVAGPEISRLGRPLGHTDKTLFLGVEDAMAMQELSLQRDEILERSNAFMNEKFFLDLKVRLRQDQIDLSTR